MADCALEKLTVGIPRNCQPTAPGVQDEAIIFNWEDIDFSLCTYDASNPMIMTGLVLKGTSPATKGFLIKGQRMSNVKTATFAPTKYSPAWTHSFSFIIADNDPVAKKRIVEISNGKFVVMYANNYINTSKATTPQDSTYEVIGIGAGLYLTEGNDTNADANGGWFLKLATASDAKEPYAPYQYFVTSIAATEAARASLI
jgi:hypothetical protein